MKRWSKNLTHSIEKKRRAAIAVFTGIGAGIGIGHATGKAVEAIARQPEAESKISKNLILGCALAEATAIYGFIIGILIIFFLK